MQPIYDAVHEKYDGPAIRSGRYAEKFSTTLQKKIVRNWLYEGKRVDAEASDEIRPLAAKLATAQSSRFRYLHQRSDTGNDYLYSRPCFRCSEA
ncbi:hypothetical protein [Ruminococcus albus]|uniref:hypothetical protein n=1 Tax=Ruminococcus albus TaxID=1264 RepID=UPI0004670EB0